MKTQPFTNEEALQIICAALRSNSGIAFNPLSETLDRLTSTEGLKDLSLKTAAVAQSLREFREFLTAADLPACLEPLKISEGSIQIRAESDKR